jgi:hypothetical protein
MKTIGNALVLAAGLALAAGASAGPGGKGPGSTGVRQVTPPPDGGVAAIFADNFDGYATGSTIVGQGGWELWYTGGLDATVTDLQADSDPNSLMAIPGTDVVQQFSIDDGVWEFTVDTYMPATGGGDGFVIMMNQYQTPGDSWSMQVRFAALEGIVESQFDLSQQPLVFDQWVEFRAVIDLDNDSWDSFYNGQPLGVDLLWTDNGFANPVPGITSIAALDLYSQTATTFFYDNVSLQPAGGGCYPDCDENTVLDFFDFLCYLNAFDNEDAYADCEANGIFDFFDFLCYLNAFDAGC